MCSPCSSCTMAVCVAGTRMMLPSSRPHTRRPCDGMYTLAVTWRHKRTTHSQAWSVYNVRQTAAARVGAVGPLREDSDLDGLFLSRQHTELVDDPG